MPSPCQLETLFPHEIRARVDAAPWILIPVGAIEWHGHHNVVGLDGLKAHGQLLRVAEKVGGLVYPPIYTGHFTGDSGSPWTYMIGADALRALLRDLLLGFERDGFKKAVILAGHYPNHIFVARELAEAWRAETHTLELLALRENHLPEVEGDHAAAGETSMMLDLRPDLVDLARAGTPADGEAEKGNWIATPLEHPLHGVMGRDPRRFASAAHGRRGNDLLVDAIAGWLRTGEITRLHDR